MQATDQVDEGALVCNQEGMQTPSLLSIVARYAIGGTLISIFLHCIMTSGSFLAIVWLYGWNMAPLTMAFAVLPSLLATPGAMIGYRAGLGWRMAFAVASAALLTLVLVIWINGNRTIAEQLLFAPLAALAALPACLVDWMIEQRDRLRHGPMWLRISLSVATLLGLILTVVGTIYTLQHPPALTWP